MVRKRSTNAKISVIVAVLGIAVTAIIGFGLLKTAKIDYTFGVSGGASAQNLLLKDTKNNHYLLYIYTHNRGQSDGTLDIAVSANGASFVNHSQNVTIPVDTKNNDQWWQTAIPVDIPEGISAVNFTLSASGGLAFSPPAEIVTSVPSPQYPIQVAFDRSGAVFVLRT